MFAKLATVLALAAVAIAGPFVTQPIASTRFVAGTPVEIRWQDNGQAPSLKDFGPASISLYVGNAIQQTLIQQFNASFDVSTANSLTVTIDPKVGANSDQYFIRIDSVSLKDTTNPQYPAQSFSAKFAVDAMTGTFSAEALAQIAGQSSAPLAGSPQTTAVTSATNTQRVLTTSTTSTTSSATKSSTASSAPTSGAISQKAGFAGILLGAVVGAAML